jgi:hypothetical protein
VNLFGIQLWGRTDPAPVRKAMEDHRYTHPNCEACGRMPVVIHHIIPVAVNASKGDDPGNLMSLCTPCHIAYGHGGDPGCHQYVPNIRQVLSIRKVTKI